MVFFVYIEFFSELAPRNTKYFFRGLTREIQGIFFGAVPREMQSILFGDRLMVGQLVLVQSIGVRIPVPEQD
jgi:hypothetical protein